MPEFLTGTDPTWNKALSTYANGGRLVQGNGPYPAGAPNRTEYYKPVGGSDFTATAAWNLPNGQVSISDRHYSPIQHMMDIPRMHAKGLTGAGVKIVVIEEYGYSNDVQHEAIGEIAGTYDQYNGTVSSSYEHTTNIVSTIAAKPTGSGKLVGGAYGASTYMAKISDLTTEINWARSIGARIITITADIFPNQDVPADTVAAIRAFQRSGGVIICSAGNGGSLGMVQKICGITDVVGVGSTVGGTVLEFQDVFYARKVQPRNGRSLDFALPAFTWGATFTALDEYGAATGSKTSSYKLFSNTSATCPQTACAFALLMQKYPTLSGKNIYRMLRGNSRSFSADGVTCYVPSLNFLR